MHSRNALRLMSHFIVALLLIAVLTNCAIGSYGSTVDGKYSVPGTVNVSSDISPQVQPDLPKFEQVLGYYGLAAGSTNDSRAFQLHLSYSEESGSPTVSVRLSQGDQKVVEVISKPRRWVPWGWFTTPSDKQKLLDELVENAVRDFDSDLKGFMKNVRIDNEPREGEKKI